MFCAMNLMFPKTVVYDFNLNRIDKQDPGGHIRGEVLKKSTKICKKLRRDGRSYTA